MAAGLTQGQLAIRAGTGQAAISELERGRVEPSFDRLAGLIELTGHELGVTIGRRRLSIDEPLFLENLRLFPEERLELAVRLSCEALALRSAGRQASRERVERHAAELRELAGL